MEKNWKSYFKQFFIQYFIIGIAALVVGFILQLGISNLLTAYPFWLLIVDISKNMFITVGVALIVASFFSYSIESKDFIEHVKKILEGIVISKNFLDRLSVLDKKDALSRILKPSEMQINLYSNINDYFTETIDNSLELIDTNFKSHVSIVINAKIIDNTVCFEESITHRLYKIKDSFNPIVVGFEDERSTLNHAEVVGHDGNNISLNSSDFVEEKKIEESGFEWTQYSYNIPEQFNNSKHLTVNMKLSEYGYDHWKLFTYKTITPADGIKIILNCEEGLIVKDFMIFDNNRKYTTHCNDDRKFLEITCSQWISPGVGMNILVAKS